MQDKTRSNGTRIGQSPPDTGRTQHRRYGGRTSSERAGQRRRQLLTAALRLYGDAGFRSTTVKAICREAGLTERYFYESFGNSEQLLCAVCSWSMERMRSLAREAVERAGQDPDKRLIAAAGAYFDYVKANPGHARIVLFEMDGVSRATSEHLRNEMKQSAALIVQLHFDPLDVHPPETLEPELLAQALLGALYQLAREWSLTGFERPANTLTRHFHALYAGLIRSWVDYRG